MLNFDEMELPELRIGLFHRWLLTCPPVFNPTVP